MNCDVAPDLFSWSDALDGLRAGDMLLRSMGVSIRTTFAGNKNSFIGYVSGDGFCFLSPLLRRRPAGALQKHNCHAQLRRAVVQLLGKPRLLPG